MTTLDKAIHEFGFEDVRTIAIAALEEKGMTEQAEELFKILTEGDEDAE